MSRPPFFVLVKCRETPKSFAHKERARSGNHTHTHLNGWKTNKTQYLKDIDEANRLIKSNLFRPPYGKLHWKAKRSSKFIKL